MARIVYILTFAVALVVADDEIWRGTPRAFAASFGVNSTVDAAPGDGVCEAAVAGECTLRAAIQEANALPGDDSITVFAGVYTLALAGINEDASATGDLDITSPLSISGVGAANTIIDGGGIDRVFHVVAASTDAVWIGSLTIRNGSTFMGGGGLYFQSGRGVLIDSTVSSNAARAGGGLHNAGSLTVDRSVIDGNAQFDIGIGGGVWNEGELQLISSAVTNNQAEDMGAGVGNGSGVLAIVESTVGGNTNVGGAGGAGVMHSGDGGGLWNDGRTFLTDTIVQGNSADSEGGGILNADNGTLEITGGAIDSNSAVVGPGGILNEGNLSITGATISNNSASIAGGILNSFGIAFIYDSTLSGNSATQVCGGLCAAGGSTNVFTSLITGNSAPEGGGIWGPEAGMTLTNSTISGNSATGDGGGIAYCYCYLRHVTVTGNTADADSDGTGDGGGILIGSQSALNSGCP